MRPDRRPAATSPRTITVWAPKGGVGATTLAVNLCGLAAEWGVAATYLDADACWGDGASWLGTGGRGSGVVAGAVLRAGAAEPPRDPIGGCRVVDVPSGHLPPTFAATADLGLVVVATDLASLRRARLAADRGWVPGREARLAVLRRPGAELTPADAGAVLDLPVAVTLPFEPGLVPAGDRGRLVWPAARSAWAAAVREFAAGIFGPASRSGSVA